MQALSGFRVATKAKTNPVYAAITLAAENRLDNCFELVKAGERNMNVLCNELDIRRETLIRYLNKLSAKKLIRIYSVKGCKYKILGTIDC